MTTPRDLSLLRHIEFRVSNGIRPDPEYFHDGVHVLLDHFLHQLAEAEPERVKRIQEGLAALDGQPKAAAKVPPKVDPFAVTVDPALEAPFGRGLLLRVSRTLRSGGVLPGSIVSEDGVIVGLTAALDRFRGDTSREPEVAAALGIDEEMPRHALAAHVLWQLRHRGLVPKDAPHPDAALPHTIEDIGPSNAELRRLAVAR